MAGDEGDLEATTVAGDDRAETDASELSPGSSFGRYVVVRELGSGAMGVVYQAYDPDLDRMVAVKRIRTDGRGDAVEARQRLQREAQAMAKLQHPNVIAVHDVGIAQGGLFVAMELVDGGTLRDWLKQERPWKEVVEVFVQAGRGLAAAHRAGLVHRDFKPANVLVAKDGRVRVLDFGLVSAPRSEDSRGSLSASQVDDMELTRGGTVLGTPGYMAPEQHHGRPADARSDIYAYCVALFEGLYGHRPFAGTSVARLARSKEAMEISTVSDRRIPPRLHGTVLRGLAVAPDARWPTMDELIDALARDLSGGRSIARVVGAIVVVAAVAAFANGVRSSDSPCADVEAAAGEVWSAERRAAGQGAFEATGAPFADVAWERLSVTVDAWAAEWGSARREVCAATRVRKEQSESVMRMRMACLDDRLEELRTLVELAESADQSMVARLPRAARGLGEIARCRTLDESAAGIHRPEDPKERARGDEARHQLARVSTLYQAGRYADASERATQVVASLKDVNDPAVRGEAMYWLGSAQDRQGKHEDAEHSLFESVYAAQAARDGRTQSRAWTRLAWVVGSRLSRWDEGLRHARHARAVYESLDPDPVGLMGILGTTGSILFSAGRLTEALDYHGRALAEGQAALAPDDPRLSVPLVNLGLTHYARNEAEHALRYYERALQIEEDTYGPDHPVVATTVDDIGLALHDLGEHDQARERLERALSVRRAAFGRNHPLVSLTMRHLGDVAMCQGRLQVARRWLDEAIEIDTAVGKADDRRAAFTLVRSGELSLREGNPDGAKQTFERALGLHERLVPEDHADLAFPLTGLGRSELALGDVDAALIHLERASILRRDEPDPTLRAETAFALAKALLHRGQAERARRLAQAASEDFARASDPLRDRSGEVQTWLRERQAEAR